MNKSANIIFSIFLALILVFSMPCSTFALKKKNPSEGITLSAINNEGNKNIFGSVLDPNINQVLLLLPKPLLYIIRKYGTARLNINVVSSLDSTKTYTVPANALSIQRKRIKGLSGRFLVVNFASVSSPSGVTISPSSLPSGDYKLRLIGDELDATTDTFNYQTPILIVGVVKSSNNGFITVEDLNGNLISEKTVAISPNGSFLTEVRANNLNNIKDINKKRNNFKLKSISFNGKSTDNSTQENNETVTTGIVHAVTDKDLYAITALDNDAESNSLKVNKPLILSESTSLTANIGLAYKPLAKEVAENQLTELESGTETSESSDDLGCDIFQFDDRCDLNNEDILYSIGADFKDYIKNSQCNFPEFNLIREIISESPEDANLYIGKGYCENAITRQNEDITKPCQVYAEVLSKFKSGAIKQLPCPPLVCEEFSNIKPPRCINPKEFCSDNEDKSLSEETEQICRGSKCKPVIPSCIARPRKDLYCARIGLDISEEECFSQNSQNFSSFKWTTGSDSNGQEYCIPSVSSQENITKECEVISCHRACEETYKSDPNNTKLNYTPSNPEPETCPVCDCHIGCDINSGRRVECNAQSKYFSNKCCNENKELPNDIKLLQGNNKGPVPIDIKSCLCEDPDNFDDRGIVIDGATSVCANICPEEYEKDPNKSICLPVCETGLVRDPNGFCKKKCPPGFIEDESGNCNCPAGQFPGPSGKCESFECPDYCKNIPMVREYLNQVTRPQGGSGSLNFGDSTGSNIPRPATSGFGDTTGGMFISPECQRCFGSKPIGTCGVGQYADPNGICRCNLDGSIATSLGPEGCKKQNSRYCEAGEKPSEKNCTCASPGYLSDTGICQCPPGYSIAYSALGCSSILRYCNPGETPQPLVCQCVPGSTNNGSSCQCSNGQPYTATGCGTSTFTCPPPYIKDPVFSNQCNCPPSTPYELGTTCVSTCPSNLVPTAIAGTAYSSTRQVCKCTDGSYPTGSGTCSSSTYYCSPGIASTTTNPCTCNPSGGTYLNSNNICTCTSLTQTYTKENGCSNSLATSNYCSPGIVPTATNPCTCAPGGVFNLQNGLCQCTNGQAYTQAGCSNISCPPATPIRCSDNTCAVTLATCPVSSCPPATPYKCSDGSCAITQAGCGSTTTHTCALGEVSNSSNPCTCATGATVGSNGQCQCTNGQVYASGGCPGSTTRTCTVGEANTSSNPCTCAGTATFGTGNTCQCPNNNTPPYTATGCGSTTTHTCTLGEVSSSSNPCTCASGATVGSNGQCQCTNGQVYASGGCPVSTTRTCGAGEGPNISSASPCTCQSLGGTTTNVNGYCKCPSSAISYTAIGCRVCPLNEVYSSSNPCQCAGTATYNSQNVCSCPSGGTYSESGCTPPPTITLTSVTISGSNVTISHSVDPYACLLVKDTNNTTIKPGNLCGTGSFNSVFPTSDFTPSLVSGTQVKLCNQDNSNNCSSTVAVTQAESITLNSVSINGGTVTIDFNAN